MAEFRRATESRRRQSRKRQSRKRALGWAGVSLAAAAALALAVGLGFRLPGFLSPGEGGGALARIATLERLSGSVSILNGSGASAEALATGLALTENSVLSTGSLSNPEGEGRVAFRLADGVTVRLDHGSEVRLTSAASLELLAGALYVDSDDGLDGLEIATVYGQVRDIGTRFEVRWSAEEEALRIRVRDGRVQLIQDGTTHEAGAREELTAYADGGLARGQLATYDEGWDWIREVLPRQEIEGARLADFLRWVTRETGQSLNFEDPALEAQAEVVTLHGSIEDLDLEEAVSLVLAGSGLVARWEEAELWIQPAR